MTTQIHNSLKPVKGMELLDIGKIQRVTFWIEKALSMNVIVLQKRRYKPMYLYSHSSHDDNHMKSIM